MKSEDHKIVRDLGFSLLAEGTILKIKADGYSMYPSIKPGTTIFIEPFKEYFNLAPGQIIALKRESGFVVHRLIRKETGGDKILYYTRGDSCKYEDKPVTGDQIAGKVIRVEDRKQRIREGSSLVTKPCYFFNRNIVWFILKIKRIHRFLITRPAGPITILMLFPIPLCSLVIPVAIGTFVFFVVITHFTLTTKCTTLENSGTSTIRTPSLLATPCPQGGAQTQKSLPACRSDSAGRDLGVSYIVGELRTSQRCTKNYIMNTSVIISETSGLYESEI